MLFTGDRGSNSLPSNSVEKTTNEPKLATVAIVPEKQFAA